MKICSKCKIEKEEEKFNKNSKNKKTGLSSYCKECVRNSSKIHYINNIEIYKENYQKHRVWYDEYKNSLKCLRCEENHPSCLEFHHLDPNEKEGGISEMLKKRIDKEIVLKEIEKCIVLYSNCHKKEHYKPFHLKIAG